MHKQLYLVIVLLILPGCVSQTDEASQEISSTNGDSELQGINIVAQTLGRDVDGPETYDILEESGNNSTLILWAAAGCNGCHQWTQMIRECVDNGTISKDMHIVTVHRYPRFEGESYVNNTYGNNTSDTYSPWPVLMPEDGDTAVDAKTGASSSVPLPEAFNNPTTPTLQVLDSEGQLIWQSKTYRSDFSVIQEIVGVMS